MPNWSDVYVTITAPKEIKEKIKDQLISDTRYYDKFDKCYKENHNIFDLDKIIKTPMDLNYTSVGSIMMSPALNFYCWKNNFEVPTNKIRKPTCFLIEKEKNPENLDSIYDCDEMYCLGRHIYQNIQKYGYVSWYDWRIDNWGTKWNTEEASIYMEIDDDKIIYNFKTAWSAPCEAILELSKQYPEAVISMDDNQEDGMYFFYKFQNGKTLVFKKEEPKDEDA